MGRRFPLLRRGALLLLLVGLLLTASGGAPSLFEYRLHREIAAPTFSVVGFVVRELPTVLGLAGATRAVAASQDDVVRQYLRAAEHARDAGAAAAPGAEDRALLDYLAARAERVLSEQVGAMLGEQHLGLGGPNVFPPVRFVFREPPLMLVVSPREQVGLRAAVPLENELTVADRAAIEARAERLGVSALVVQIGGLATYPAMLPAAGDVPWLLEAVAHEWAHNYFTLRPVGWRYAAGIERDPAMIAINETAADLIGREIAREALARFYGEVPRPAAGPSVPVDARTQRFRARMREIRERVDALLGAGQVAEAEQYMAEQRVELEREGFALRKLNQAYFAFYGSYADGPAGRFDPVVGDVKRLRDQSATLHDFAAAVSSVSSPAELRALVGS